MSKNLNYGIVGNGSTAALISEHGFVEWFCLPHFDSSSCFAALLDDERGGKFGIKLVGDYDVRQSYVPHTNILTTHYVSDEAEFKIFDFMPCYYHPGTTNLYNPSELYRYIRYIKGVPRFSVVYEPRPDYARGECVLAISFNHIDS